jgi:hypothetical protein
MSEKNAINCRRYFYTTYFGAPHEATPLRGPLGLSFHDIPR